MGFQIAFDRKSLSVVLVGNVMPAVVVLHFDLIANETHIVGTMVFDFYRHTKAEQVHRPRTASL